MNESNLIAKLANIPAVFIFLRRVLENNFKGEMQVIEKEQLSGAGTLLDLGCGTGQFSVFFKPEDYVGVDINEKYIEYAQKKYARTFKVMDAQALDLAADSFSNVMVIGMFHHLADDMSLRILQEIKRVLAPGGKLVIAEDVRVRGKGNLVGKLIQRLDKGDFIRTDEEYANLFSQAFTISNSYPMNSGVCDYQVFVCS